MALVRRAQSRGAGHHDDDGIHHAGEPSDPADRQAPVRARLRPAPVAGVHPVDDVRPVVYADDDPRFTVEHHRVRAVVRLPQRRLGQSLA